MTRLLDYAATLVFLALVAMIATLMAPGFIIERLMSTRAPRLV
jgi:hypothetical protein